LKRRWGTGEGGGPGFDAAWRGKRGRERGTGFGDVDQHGTDVAAQACSDNGRWRMPRGSGL
jgi:hypothetical protein